MSEPKLKTRCEECKKEVEYPFGLGKHEEETKHCAFESYYEEELDE